MATKTDYYQTLGISKTASEAEIKSAYRRLARQHHPDIDKSPGAAARFKEISEAYQVLADSQKRKTYDQFGHSAFDPGSGYGSPGGGFNPFGGGQGNPFGQGGFSYSWSSSGGSGFADPFDLFEQIFGGGFAEQFSQGFRRRPTYQLELTFDEAINGTTKQIEIEKIENNVRKKERMSIKVPAGVDNGTKMRFSDIDIVFRVKRHPEFLREGADVFSEISLTIPELVLGNIVEVNTVDGKVKLKVPSGAEPGSLIRIKGKGAPRLDGGKGDHYVRVKLEMPKNLTPEEHKLYEQLAKLKLKKKSWF